METLQRNWVVIHVPLNVVRGQRFWELYDCPSAAGALIFFVEINDGTIGLHLKRSVRLRVASELASHVVRDDQTFNVSKHGMVGLDKSEFIFKLRVANTGLEKGTFMEYKNVKHTLFSCPEKK